MTCEKGVVEGEFKHNEIYTGKGVFMYNKFATCKGEWKRGTLYGTITDKDGATHSGTFTQRVIQRLINASK